MSYFFLGTSSVLFCGEYVVKTLILADSPKKAIEAIDKIVLEQYHPTSGELLEPTTVEQISISQIRQGEIVADIPRGGW